jgi:hypothetical protein
MKQLVLLIFTACTACIFAQRLVINKTFELSEDSYLDYFQGTDNTHVWCERCDSLADSSAYDEYQLSEFRFKRSWYQMKDGTTVELIRQKDGTWFYLQKKGTEELIVGECRFSASRTASFITTDQQCEDSVVYAYTPVKLGEWMYSYSGGALSGTYSNGEKTGEWHEFRDYLFGSQLLRLIHASRFYGADARPAVTYMKLNAEQRETLICSANWGLPGPGLEDFSVFDNSGRGLLVLKQDGTVKQRPACGRRPAEHWKYDGKTHLLSIGDQTYEVDFVSPYTLIIH